MQQGSLPGVAQLRRFGSFATPFLRAKRMYYLSPSTICSRCARIHLKQSHTHLQSMPGLLPRLLLSRNSLFGKEYILPVYILQPKRWGDRYRMGPGVEMECGMASSAILWMGNSRESKNSKFKPVLLFVMEGQNIFKSLLALFTTLKYFDIQYESFHLYSFPGTHKC